MKFLVATVTPFDTRGRVDLARLRAHVMWLSALGVDGFVPTGLTGEFLYLTDREREAVHRTVLDTARDKVVYPCTWDPSPSTTRYLTEAAGEQGATGVLMPPPLAYALPDDVVEAWFRHVRTMSGLPVLALHSPDHLHTGISSEVYHRLRDDDVLAGMQDDSADIFRLKRTCQRDEGAVFASGDRLLPQARSIEGCAGFVSDLANAWPGFCLRAFHGESDLDEALIDRIQRTKAAGGLRALKSLLRMGCRSPLVAPDRAQVEALPAAEI